MSKAFLSGADFASQRLTSVGDATSGTDAANRNIASEDFKEFYQSGVLSTGLGVGRLYFPWDITILGCWISLGTAPTGATFIVDVNKNGTTIYTTQGNRPSISASSYVSSQTTPDVTTLTALTDYLTLDIDQIGSIIAGSDLVLGIRYRRT